MRWVCSVAAVLAAAAAVTGCGGSEDEPTSRPPVVEDPGPVHVHGLGVNPADGALFIATHTGLFRSPRDDRKTRRVKDRFQDTMGFTVVGPDRFLGSGHPDGREDLPPFLGLLRSTDAGQSWDPVSLLGERDFHVLEASGRRIYGFGSDFETRRTGLLVSDDAGASWNERAVPEPLLSLAIDPRNPARALASGEQGLYLTADAGRRWRSLSNEAGLLAWPRGATAYLVTLDGRVRRSIDGGIRWRHVGDVGGPPSAFDATAGELYVALHDGSIKLSADGGRTWRVRSRP
ncbi:MAG: hypothetical protein H0T69_13810 [Thermoleophilaceae bacterium]|nr:hypothetical protein [Thermoleophilaceae bacterium]